MSSLHPSVALTEPADIRSDPRVETARLALSQTIVLSAWFGLLAGILEGGMANSLRGVSGFAVRVSPEILWIAPVFNLVLFLLLGFGLFSLFRLIDKSPSISLLAGLFTWIILFGILLLLGLINQYAALILSLGVGVQTSRMLHSHQQGALNLIRKTIGILIIGAMLIGIAGAFWDYGRERYQINKIPAAKSGSPNVILITLDTLRADHVSAYGYARETTPNLDHLAKSGVLFENAFSNSSWTLPAHASLFTGRLPNEHKADWSQPLSDKYPTLAEVLYQRGYLTGAFSANTSYVTSEWGLGRGFTHFAAHGDSLIEDATSTVYGRKLALNVLPRVNYFNIPGRKNAQEVNQKLFDWLDHAAGKPFFAFLNYFDIHDPYLTDRQYQTRFGDTTRGDLINFQFQANAFRRKPTLTPQEIQSEVNSYDGCLSYLDAKLGELFAELSRRGLDKNTLLVITSDHGEAFGSHDLFGHGNGLYLDSLHVPLIIVWPSKVPSDKRVIQLASLHNVPATILELLGETNSGIPGDSLARLWSADAERSSQEPIVAELTPGRFVDGPSSYPTTKGDLRSLVSDQWHFIVSKSGQTELYAWREDRAETRNLAETPEGRKVVEELKQRLASSRFQTE